jgi:mono/diheme cytochrome c family protein
MRRLIMMAVVSLSALVRPADAQSLSGDEVEIWSSRTSLGRPVGSTRQVVHLGKLPNVALEQTDIQYGAPKRYLGVSLVEILKAFPAPSWADIALLHFANGMQVGVPFREQEATARLEVFVARRVWTTYGDGLPDWDANFPAILKKDTGLLDVRPIEFRGNKVAVKTAWHPWVPDAQAPYFSPWLYVDTLVAIELVAQADYARWFPHGTSALAEHGYALFTQRCRFCHGVNGVGASFGWDFVDPIPLYTYRDPESLYRHVRYREGVAASKGLMMPGFADATPEDIRAVWEWMKEATGVEAASLAPSRLRAAPSARGERKGSGGH